MLVQAALRQEIPSLRRCGRAFTGRQRVADVSIVQLMNELLAEPPAALSRAEIHGRYLATLEACAKKSPHGALDHPCTPAYRRFHWLTTVEEFSEEAAAEVLGIPADGVSCAREAYRTDTIEQEPAKIQIIEDEALIAYDLKRIVTQMRHRVTAIARTRDAAIENFLRDVPDLILSDVQLADGSSGIDAVDTIQRWCNVPVAFITSFPERFLEGKSGEPTFLITKPFVPSIVQSTVSQALYLSRKMPRDPVSANHAQEFTP